MPFAKGHPKPPGSGRQKNGSARITVAMKLAEMGCDPFVGLAKIAEDTDNKTEVRVRAYAELAQYLQPKKRAIEARLVDKDGEDRELLDFASVRAYMQSVPD